MSFHERKICSGECVVFYSSAIVMLFLFIFFFLVPLGVIAENENEREGMTEIMELLHKYVPNCMCGYMKKIGFAGDQLSVERARNC